MANEASYGAACYCLTIDDTPAMVPEVSGGTPVAEVVTIQDGSGKSQKKTISTLKFEDIKFKLGVSMGQPMIDWINSFLDNQFIKKQGFVTYGDFDKKARGFLDFQDAIITEFTIPACDAGNKESATFDLACAVRASARRAGDNSDVQGQFNSAQKLFQPSNFRLSIGDLPCKRVNKIDAISMKAKVAQDDVGELRIQEKIPTTMEFGNLVVTLSAADADPWEQWFDDFCIKGNNGDDKELTGAIEWLSPNTQEVLASLEMLNIGIFKLSHDPSKQGDSVRRIKAEMYVEKYRFKLGG